MDNNNKRLITFILVCIGILLVWQKFVLEPHQKDLQKAKKAWNLKNKKKLKTNKVKGKKGKATASKTKGSKAKTAASATSRPSTRPSTRPALRAASTRPAPPKVRIAKVKTQTASFKNKLIIMNLSNQGGGLVHATLSNFYKKGTLRKKKPSPLDLLAKQGKEGTFVEQFLDSNLAAHKSVTYKTLKANKAGTVVTLIGQIPSKRGGHLEVQKVYTFRKNSYKFDVSYQLRNKTGHILSTRMALILRDKEDPKNLKGGGFMSQPTIFEAICRKADQNKPERVTLDKMKKQKRVAGDIAYAGINRQYFLMSVVPRWAKKDASTDCSFDNKKVL